MSEAVTRETLATRMLASVERVGNKLPDPTMLFVGLLVIVWVLSWLLSYVDYELVDPRTSKPLVINNLLTGPTMTEWLSVLVTNFTHFHPVGVVLVAMLGIGVAEHTGFINTGLRALLGVTAKWLITPMVILVGIVSHSAVDAGYVLVIPLGGIIFYAAGRHPLAGIAAAFAGVSGGFSANFVPSSLDPLLQGLSQAGARILDADIVLNPLNNYFFTTASSVLIIGLGWYLTDKVIEPRLKNVALDGDLEDLPTMHALEPQERKGMNAALIALLLGVVVMVVTSWPADSAWRDADGSLATGAAPIMRSIVSLIFLMFVIPGIISFILAKLLGFPTSIALLIVATEGRGWKTADRKYSGITSFTFVAAINFFTGKPIR
jgi:aminobenzoyl-glutamate transport protein